MSKRGYGDNEKYCVCAKCGKERLKYIKSKRLCQTCYKEELNKYRFLKLKPNTTFLDFDYNCDCDCDHSCEKNGKGNAKEEKEKENVKGKKRKIIQYLLLLTSNENKKNDNDNANDVRIKKSIKTICQQLNTSRDYVSRIKNQYMVRCDENGEEMPEWK